MTVDADSRTRILDAAEQAFADSGLAGARVAGIATAAGVNKAMLYYYFESKEKLYGAVVQRVFEQIVLRATARGSLDPDAGVESLVALVDAYGQVLEAHPSFVRLLLRGVLDAPESTFAELRPRIGALLPLLTGKIRRGQAEGQLNPSLDPMLVMPSTVAPVIFFALMHPLLGELSGIPKAELATRWRQHLRTLSLEGLLARPENA